MCMKENTIKEILNHFPDSETLVFFMVDTIRESIYGLNGETIDFCESRSERKFWYNNIIDYRYLFTYAILKYYNKKYSGLRERLLGFQEDCFCEISIERESFLGKFPPTNENTINITDYLHSDSDFTNILSGSERDGAVNILKIKKILLRQSDNYNQKYNVDYKYAILLDNDIVEELDYDDSYVEMCSDKLSFTSSLNFLQSEFVNTFGVVSFCRTNNGYVYIVAEDGHFFIRGQGFIQTSKLLKAGKTPICLKSFGARVIVLMSDGTLTSNFGVEMHNIKKAWFDNNGMLKTIEL